MQDMCIYIKHTIEEMKGRVQDVFHLGAKHHLPHQPECEITRLHFFIIFSAILYKNH